MQGPLGWQSVSGLPAGETLLCRDFDFFMHAEEHTEINGVYWEATIQKHVQEELYNSSLEVYICVRARACSRTHVDHICILFLSP
jgi:spatacsin